MAGKDSLVGCVEEIDEGLITGWAYDAGQPNRRLLLDVFMSGNLIGQTVADREHAASPKAPGGDGRHGFLFRIPRDLNGIKPTAFSVGFHETGQPLPRERREPDFVPPPDPIPPPPGLDFFTKPIEAPPPGSQAEFAFRLERLEERIDSLSRQVERLNAGIVPRQSRVDLSQQDESTDDDEESPGTASSWQQPETIDSQSPFRMSRIWVFIAAVVLFAVLFSGFQAIGKRLNSVVDAASGAPAPTAPAVTEPPSAPPPAQ